MHQYYRNDPTCPTTGLSGNKWILSLFDDCCCLALVDFLPLVLLRSRLERRGDASLGASLVRRCGHKYDVLDYKWNRERVYSHGLTGLRHFELRIDGGKPCRPSIVSTFWNVKYHGRCGIQGIV